MLVATPDFAPRIGNAVTMYDLLFDMGVRSLPVPQNALYYNGGPLQRLRALHDDFQPSADVEFPSTIADFATEIQPVLLHGYQYRYVTELVNQKHDSLISPALASPDPQNAKSWQGVFVYLRTPLGATSPTGKGTMPRTRGDDPYTGSEPDAVRNLTLTRTQYGLMRRWSGGFFDPPPATPPPPDTTITPAGLDRAALENCVGGAFFPGIEASWQIRNPGLFWEPFRLNLNATSQYIGEAGQPIRAGHFSRQMAVPWQADFNDCRTEGDYGWWPGQRPTAVFLNPTDSLNQRVDWARPDTTFAGNNHQSNHSDMVALWYKFGFVVQVQPSGAFIETERAPQVP